MNHLPKAQPNLTHKAITLMSLPRPRHAQEFQSAAVDNRGGGEGGVVEAVAAAAASSSALSSPQDIHALPQHQPTHLQTALLIAYLIITTLWLLRVGLSLFRTRVSTSSFLSKIGLVRPNSSASSSLSSPSSTSSTSSSSSSSSIDKKSEIRHSITIESAIDKNNFDGFSEEDRQILLQEHSIKHGNNFENSAFINPSVDGSATDKHNAIDDKNVIIPHDKNSSTIITIGQNGLTENISERHGYNNNDNTVSANQRREDTTSAVTSSPSSSRENHAKDRKSEPIKSSGSGSGSAGPPPVTFDKFLTSFVLFGIVMIYFYFCDYWKILPQGQSNYSRDIFLFLVFLFFLVGLTFTINKNEDKILHRDQTEEWKGWMQVMFVWYHYFKAKEWYNWIRVYIACYVWMTGFGNFSFFWVRKDFSMWRMIKMMFRLNFLVIFVAMVTNNEYMLYYICAMHTYWFLTVYVFMRVLNSWNTDRLKMAAKFGAYAVCNFIVFDIPGVSTKFFRPVQLVLGLHDNKGDLLHEWAFRAGLDHWACFVGMLCAYNYPHFEALMTYLDSQSVSTRESLKKFSIRLGIGLCSVLVGVVWYFSFMRKDKYAYNALHPYTSPVPILIFIVLRNIHPVLRTKHIGMFSWLGKITLETYLSQLHVYLMANARTLLVYIPDYLLLNFALATIVYLGLSRLLFSITNDASNFLIPKDQKRMCIHFVSFLFLMGVSAGLAFLVGSNSSSSIPSF